MPRKSIKAIRRDELVEAAIGLIAEEGLGKATMAGIATRAGMSPALVSHYFGSKEDLLYETMIGIVALWRHELMRRLPPDPTPKQRLEAIIDGSFSAKNFTESAYDAWLQFWLVAMHDPRFLALHRTINRRFWANIRYALRPVVPAAQVDEIADGLAALIDGYCWRFALDRNNADFAMARRMCWDYLLTRCPALAG